MCNALSFSVHNVPSHLYDLILEVTATSLI